MWSAWLCCIFCNYLETEQFFNKNLLNMKKNVLIFSTTFTETFCTQEDFSGMLA